MSGKSCLSSTSIANDRTHTHTDRQDSENPTLWFLRLITVKPLRGDYYVEAWGDSKEFTDLFYGNKSQCDGKEY